MKKFLPNKKTFAFSVMFAILFLFISFTGFALTKTWNGGTGGSKNWTTAGNWTPSGAPASTDDVVFSTAGTITFTTMPASGSSYLSLYISSGTFVSFSNGTACTIIIGGGAPDPDLSIAGGSSLTLASNMSITLAASANANISGDFLISPGCTFNSNAAGVGTSVFGTVNSQGTVNGTLSTLTFGSGGAYVHNQDGGTIPTANWNSSSFCIITGVTANHPAGGNQTFGNLTYNCAGLISSITMANGVSVANDFTVLSTGGGSARLLMTAGSFTVGRDLDVEANFTVSGTTDRTLTVVRDAFISGGGNIDLCNGNIGNTGTLNVGGNFTSFGALTENGNGKGQLNFNGTVAQNFNEAGAFVNTIGIGINNAAGVTFSGNSITINDALTLTNGVLTIPANKTLTIANGNVIAGSGFGPGKHINTQVSGATQAFVVVNNMAAATAYTIPTGNGTYYLPVTLTPPNTSSFTVGVFTGITQNGLPNGTAFTAPMKQGVVDAVWTINRNSGTLGTDMTLGWPAALEGSSFATYTTNQIGIAHWDNPAWGNCVGTGDNSANTATRNGVTVFSPFSVGKTPYVLPIKFSYVNAAKTNGSNTVYWKAACSSAEVTFNVERSTDGINFSTVNSIFASQLRCAQPFNYADNSSSAGTVFYRIRSVEVTGVVTYSTIVKLSDQQKDMQLKAVLPNPVTDQAQLSINSPQKDEISLVVVSMDGKIVQQSKVQLQAGASIVNLDVSALLKGVYMVKGTFANGESNTLRFIKQ